MTTQTQPTQTISVPRAPTAARRSGGRIAAIIVGAMFALIGAGLATAGGAALGAFGDDGEIDTVDHSLSTRSSALVSGAAEIEDTNAALDALGHPRLRVSVKATGSTDGLFVGVGPAEKVDRYLAKSPIEEVTDVDADPFKLTTDRHPGTKRPGRPADQKFWVAQAQGRDSATLRWKIRDGDYRVVLMNADGSRGVHAEGDAGLTLPHMTPIGWSVLGGGLLLLAGGVTVIVVAARSPRRPGATS